MLRPLLLLLAVLVGTCRASLRRSESSLPPAARAGAAGAAYYPVVDRQLAAATQKQFTLQEYNSGAFPRLTYSEDSPAKTLEPFVLQLFATDGSLPTSSLRVVQVALEQFLVSSLNGVFQPYHGLNQVHVRFTRQNTVVQSSFSGYGRRLFGLRRPTRANRHLLTEIGTLLETEVDVTFAHEPSPPLTDVEVATQFVMQNMTNFINLLKVLAADDTQLAQITTATRQAAASDDDPDDTTDTPVGAEESPESNGKGSLDREQKIFLPIIVTGCVVLAAVVLLTFRHQHDPHHNKNRHYTDGTYLPAQPPEVNVFMDEEEDIFSFEAALVESPAPASTSKSSSYYSNITMTSPRHAGRPMSSYHDEQSDIFSGLDSELASPKSDARSVFSFLTGFMSSHGGDASTVVVSNTTTAQQHRQAKALASPHHGPAAGISPTVAAALGGTMAHRVTTTANNTPGSRMSSLFTFSEEREEDVQDEIKGAPSDEDTTTTTEIISPPTSPAKQNATTVATAKLTIDNAVAVPPYDDDLLAKAVKNTRAARSPHNSSLVLASSPRSTALKSPTASSASSSGILNNSPSSSRSAVNAKISSESSTFGPHPATPSSSSMHNVPTTPISHLSEAMTPKSTNTSGGLSSNVQSSEEESFNVSSHSPSPTSKRNTIQSVHLQDSPKRSSLEPGPIISDVAVASSDDDGLLELISDATSEPGQSLSAPASPTVSGGRSFANALVNFAKTTSSLFRHGSPRHANKQYAADTAPLSPLAAAGEATADVVVEPSSDTPESSGPLTPRTKSHMIQLQWDNPHEALKNKQRAREFVHHLVSTEEPSVASPASMAESAVGASSAKSPLSSPVTTSSPRSAGAARRHAKTTAGDGTADYQASTMHAVDVTMNAGHDESFSSTDTSGLMLSDGIAGGAPKRKTISSPASSPTSPSKKKALSTSGKTPPRPPSSRDAAEMATPPPAATKSTNVSQILSSPDSNTSSEIDASKMLLNDLVWLENKIASGKKISTIGMRKRDEQPSLIDQMDSLSFASNDGDVSTSGSLDSNVHIAAPGAATTTAAQLRSIVCRDCFAPPGKLKIVIHSTKDGPAVHTVKKGSSLEGHLFPGDLIISVDNVDTRAYSAEQVMKLMTSRTRHERKITVLHFEQQPPAAAAITNSDATA